MILLARYLIIVGIVLIVLGISWPLLQKLPLGRLPGDIVIRRENFQVYFPVTTSILVSLIVSIIFWLLRK